MSHTFGSINFGNIPVAAGGGGIVVQGARQGLTVNSGYIELGSNTQGAAVATNYRYISFDAGAGLFLGELLAGNSLDFSIDNGLSTITRDAISGQTQNAVFAFDGININNSGRSAYRIYDSFTGGNLLTLLGRDASTAYTTLLNDKGASGSIGISVDNAAGNIAFERAGILLADFLDNGVGTALNMYSDAVGAGLVFFDSATNFAGQFGWRESTQDFLLENQLTGGIAFNATGGGDITASILGDQIIRCNRVSVTDTRIYLRGSTTSTNYIEATQTDNVRINSGSAFVLRLAGVNKALLNNNGMGFVNIGVGSVSAATTTALLNVQAGTTAICQINLTQGVAPTAPNNGNIWFDGTNLFMRIAGVTKTFTLV